MQQIAKNDLHRNLNSLVSLNWTNSNVLQSEITCDGVDDQKQVAGGESRSLKGGEIHLPIFQYLFYERKTL